MSDEAAFLDALRANPADDTARLVYADWLDERGEPAKAEYLRLVVTLARAEVDYARDQPHVARILALTDTLPADWRVAAGSRFKLVFYACEQVAKKVSTIKAVRKFTEGLAEAVGIVESCGPSQLLGDVTFTQAVVERDTIREAGGTVYVHPIESTERPVGNRYDIIASRCSTDSLNPSQTEECKSAFATFLQNAMNISAVRARRLAESKQVTLARHQDPVIAGERAGELWKHIRWEPFDEGYPETGPAWGIWVAAVPSESSITE